MNGKQKRVPTDTLVRLAIVVVIAFIVAALYFGRALLVPMALAILLTFMLSPAAAALERRIGRVSAVFGLALVIFGVVGASGWIVTRQALDLMARLPDYRSNIEKKIQALKLSKDSPIKRFSQMVVEVESEIPQVAAVGAAERTSEGEKKPAAPPPAPNAGKAPVTPPPPAPDPLAPVRWLIDPFLHALATMGVVLLLVIFMLLKREDLRGRFIKIFGKGRISSTTRAMEDAGERVSRYLIAQLVVNILFGAAIGIGLAVIGLPNAFLWGAIATLMRFIPYVGTFISASGPVVLALAVSPDWQVVVLTLGLFALLELVTANFLEPLLFRSSTGVSSLALIVAAIFWAWLWGVVGLILSTPLTVCVVVMGRHVPGLSFLSVLLGDEEALTPSEECYHRLLVGGVNEAAEIVDAHLKANPLISLYDNVLIPTITMAEVDFHREELQEEQRIKVLQGVRDIVEELSTRPEPPPATGSDPALLPPAADPATPLDCRVACIPLRSEKDDLAGAVLLHLLRKQGILAVSAGLGRTSEDLFNWIESQNADAVCISVIPPWNVVHTRQLCARLRDRFPRMKIIAGIWGATGNHEESLKTLRASGADEVVTSLSNAVAQLVLLSSSLVGETAPAPLPANEEQRLAALEELRQLGTGPDPLLDRITQNLARTFDAPIALLSLIDRDRQHFKSAHGLPAELAGVCDIPRDSSICTHVVAANAPMVVEDLARDRRFAHNPLLKKYHLRFYAGAPVHAPNGQPVGALCILDVKPRQFSEAEKRLLLISAENVSRELSTHAVPG